MSNYIVKNVELNWAKLQKPVSPFGTPQWELQIASESMDALKELADLGLKVKEVDGKFVANVKRKAVKADGSEQTPVRVVDGQKRDISDKSIGNGSRGNIIVYAAPYETMGRKGVTFSLNAVQVTDLVEYTGSVDFDIVGDDAGSSDSADMF